MLTYIDIETIPDQTPGSLQKIIDTIEVKAPALTKPKLIDELGLCQKADKFKSVDELKELWLTEFAEKEKCTQATNKWLKSSFDGAQGQICCICVAFDDDDVIKIHGTESEILIQLNATINDRSKFKQIEPEPFFIGHYIKGFDLPFLFKRFVINCIKPTFKFTPFGRDGTHFYDTMLQWCGYKDSISMDNLAMALALKGKTDGMDGSQVWPEYQKGNIEKIVDYCADDVECVRRIYKRMTFSN